MPRFFRALKIQHLVLIVLLFIIIIPTGIGFVETHMLKRAQASCRHPCSTCTKPTKFRQPRQRQCTKMLFLQVNCAQKCAGMASKLRELNRLAGTLKHFELSPGTEGILPTSPPNIFWHGPPSASTMNFRISIRVYLFVSVIIWRHLPRASCSGLTVSTVARTDIYHA